MGEKVNIIETKMDVHGIFSIILESPTHEIASFLTTFNRTGKVTITLLTIGAKDNVLLHNSHSNDTKY